MRLHVSSRLLLLVFFGSLCALLGLCAVLVTATVRAQSPGPQQPAGPALDLAPTEDAYVTSSAAKENFGAAAELRVAGDAGEKTVEAALLQFDLSELSPDIEILSAVLELYPAGDPNAQTPGAAKQVLYVNRSQWNEGSVTFKNWSKPSKKATPVYFESAAGATAQADVTAIVREWIGGGGPPNKGFSVVADPQGGAVARVYGSRESDRPPKLIVSYRLPPIRVCREGGDGCQPAAGAEVYDLDTGTVYAADAAGYLAGTAPIELGNTLWVRQRVAADQEATLYHTAGDLVAVNVGEFSGRPAEMRLTVSAERPLYVHDLTVSAQFHVEGDPALRDYLRDQLLRASYALYAFTDGQFMLGNIEVRQNGEGWDSADLHIYANNALAPKAVVGGSVLTDTPDISVSIPVSYSPGSISMGSYWNRFRTPPGQTNTVDGRPVPPTETQDDWSLALAHELGHWLLFLFDTYAGTDGNPDRALAESCIGSAMGDVYRPVNHAFVFDQTHWETRCNNTEAYNRLHGRNEWDTITAWHPWAVKPTAAIAAGPAAQDAAAAFMATPDAIDAVQPPAQLTTVTFVPPASPPGPPAGNVYTLAYQDGETASGEARVFLYRGEQIFDQGKPPKNGITLTVAGPEVGDRLCVYDVNDFTDDGESPRHQFGCEVIEQGDAQLAMTKDLTWQPAIAVEQVGPQQIQLHITQTLEGPPVTLTARLYPEYGTLLQEVSLRLAPDGTGTVLLDLGRPVPPLFVQLFANEPDAEPATRREAVTDRGVGGGGAFGPKRLYGGVMVQSPDGVAAFQSEAPVVLAEGESIAWQSVPAAPLPPNNQQISGQPYGLDAYPSALAEGGQVQIQYTGEVPTDGANPAQAAASLFFWNGAEWEKLPTDVTTRVNTVDGSAGATVASAPSRGVGVYALFLDKDALPTATPTPTMTPTPDPGAPPIATPTVTPTATPTAMPTVTPSPRPQEPLPDMTNRTYLPLIGAPQQ